MLNFIFPIAVYTDDDPSFVNIANKWFDNAKFYSGPKKSENFRTTLMPEGYGPGGAPVTFDPSAQLEWPGWNQFVSYHASQYLKEQRYKPYEPVLVNTWLNEVDPGGQQFPHDHYGYHISGVYYTQVPEGSGQIYFHSHKEKGKPFLHEMEEGTPATAPNWWIPVKTGTVVLFPSDLTHSVQPMNFNGVRRSIAFDVNFRWKG